MCAEKRKLNKRATAYIVLAVVLVMLIASGSTYAYLKWNGGVQNTFEYETSVRPAIEEEFNDKIKKNVSISAGDTDYSVYVRAAIVATWVDSSGNVVHAKEPVLGTDYSLNLNLSPDGWFVGDDGYYYYALPVLSGNSTDNLITECKPLEEAPSIGYKLNVDIIAQTIQSAGTTDDEDKPLVTEAWGISVDGATGNLIKPSSWAN